MASSNRKPQVLATALLVLVAAGGIADRGLAEPQSREMSPPVPHSHAQHNTKGEQPAMRQEMVPTNTSLTELVEAMRQATSEQKVEALEALVTELVAQNASMRLRLLQIQPQLMHHVAEHLAAGMSEGVRRSIAECPLMQSPPPADDDRDYPDAFNNEDLSASGSES